LFVVCSVVWFSFCDDHQLVDVSRCEKHTWSSGWWRFRYVAYPGWTLLFWALL